MSDNTHSEFSPSQLERIILCPGSIELCRTVPKRPSSSYAEEGALLHSYTQQTLEMWPEDSGIAYSNLDHEAAVLDAVSYLQTVINFNEPGLRRFQELRVRMHEHAEVYGTLDFASVSATRLDVADFKFGRGIEVSPVDNPQFLAYLDGFLNTLMEKMPDVYAHALTIPWYVHVVQPRIENYQMVEVFPTDLKRFNALIDRTIRVATSPNPPFHPGEAQCRWCDAGGVCRVRADQVRVNQIEALRVFADVQQNTASMEDIQAILARKDETIKAFAAMESHVFLELAKGNVVPGFKLVRGRSNRAWAPHVDFDLLTETFPELDEAADKLFDSKLRGPAQVEKLLTAKRRKDLEPFIVKPEGKITLAPIDSPKEAVTPSNPEEAFKDYADAD
jgi:hypothetical protein